MLMGNQLQAPVTEANLYRRVNYKLREKGKAIKKARAGYTKKLGKYYIVDMIKDEIIAIDVNLEELALELSVIKSYEVMK
jgi:hypothetical protein